MPVLDCKIIYILIVIENTTGMPHMKITRNTTKDTIEIRNLRQSKLHLFSIDFNYVKPT